MSDEEYESDYSSDSACGMLRKALPFDCTVPENFDPTKPPATAEEFLQYAAYERSKMKPWTTAKIDPSKINPAICYTFPAEYKITTPEDRLPNMQWAIKKLEEFDVFRRFVQARLESTNCSALEESPANLVKHTPDFLKSLKYSPLDKITMLNFINDELDSLDDNTPLSFEKGTWIYAILALFEFPLCPSDCSVVRDLGKKCMEIRSKRCNIEKEELDALNLFICIIAKFYGQMDLCNLKFY